MRQPKRNNQRSKVHQAKVGCCGLSKDMNFTDEVIKAVWKRQNGKCAKCGIVLIPENRDRGEVGAWHAYPLVENIFEGEHNTDNCVILCINPPNNCHYRTRYNWKDAVEDQISTRLELPYFFGDKPHRSLGFLKEFIKQYRIFYR